jgi:phosphoribosylformimino-5-aminoimidazole carboxamide ribotide isomerase
MKTNTADFIIPAIDLIGGQCVRLSQGDYAQKKVYSTSPLEVAKRFEELGVKRLHLVDLDGAKAGKLVNASVLETLTRHTSLDIDFGGGVKTKEDVYTILNAGARFVTIGSIAVKQKDTVTEWMQALGNDKFLIGCDVKGEQLALHGWLETSTETVFDLIAYYKAIGFNHFFCTDISKDGMLQGPGIDLYQKLLKQFPDLYLIGSGGVSKDEDVDDLKKVGCQGVIVGKAIYENKLKALQL